MFALDLEEIEELDRRGIIGLNRFSLYSFYDCDHLKFVKSETGSQPPRSSDLRRRISDYVEIHAGFRPTRIVLLTHLRILGYVFNPVSFYYLYDGNALRAVLAEVNNTYLEQKAFLMDAGAENSSHKQRKNFYVSPFIEFDSAFHFEIGEIAEAMRVRIDSVQEDRTVLRAVIAGRRVPLTRARITRYLFTYPLLTLRIIVLIHYHALKLWIRRVPYFAKLETDRRIRALEQGENS